MKEWQHHIRHTHKDQKDTSWCGVRLYPHDWTFTDLDHAAYSVRSGTYAQPCPACLQVVAALLAPQPSNSDGKENEE